MTTVGQAREVVKYYAFSATCHIAKYRDMNIPSDFHFPGNYAKIINSRVMPYLDLIHIVYCRSITNSNISSEIFESH